jgi:hypothetical protein
MADGTSILTLRTAPSVAAIGRKTWNMLAVAPDDPFTTYEFLDALERSNSVDPAVGWTPCHAVLERDGAVEAAAPLYLKAHSFGEYVFDHPWADAYRLRGGRYYPKLLSASPFTPVRGPRLLARTPEAAAQLALGLVELAQQAGVSSLHANFLTENDAAHFREAGCLERIGAQYHWFNRGYRDFEEFLSALASRKRKAIRRERREAQESGLSIVRLEGDGIREEHWDAFWAFYQDTGSRKWGNPYLTRSFFSLLGETLRDRILLIFAYDGARPIAGALHLFGGDALYGRYWGCLERRPFLHFELCYHQAIDIAIERGLARVEAGAQGEHKLARGYEPVATRSAHWIADASFRRSIAAYLEEERRHNAQEIAELGEFTPYRKDSA